MKEQVDKRKFTFKLTSKSTNLRRAAGDKNSYDVYLAGVTVGSIGGRGHYEVSFYAKGEREYKTVNKAFKMPSDAQKWVRANRLEIIERMGL
jgi:hypothetical protein